MRSAKPSLMNNRQFRNLVICKVANELSSAISNVALPLVILVLTDQAWLAGFAVALTTIALIASQIFGGAVVDRWRAENVLRISSAIQAIGWAIALLGVALEEPFGVIFIISGALISGGASGLDGPSEQSLLKAIVATPNMGKASAIGQAREAAAEMTEGPIGGALFALTSWAPFAGQIVLNALATVTVPNLSTTSNQKSRKTSGIFFRRSRGVSIRNVKTCTPRNCHRFGCSKPSHYPNAAEPSVLFRIG